MAREIFLYFQILLIFQIDWHPVSPKVGSVKNKGSDIPKRVALDKAGKAVKKEASMVSNF